MGIETRRNNLYFYKKRREGERVVSEYVGSAQVASLAEYKAQKDRQEKQAERSRLAELRMSMAEIDQLFNEMDSMIDLLMSAELLERGYHKQKRVWRKKRNGSQS